MQQWRIENPQSLDVAGVQRLDVRLVGGRVDVVGVSDDAVGSAAHVEVTACDGPLEVSLVDGVLRIAHENLSWGGIFEWLGSGRKAHAVVSVSVPRTCPVQVGLVTADAVVSGIVSDSTAVKSVSGDVTIDGVRSRIVARTVSGALESRSLDGDLTFTTVSGDLTVAGGTSRSVTADSVSGDVTLDLDLLEGGQIRVKTVSGDLTLRLPADAGLVVNVQSTTGTLDSGFGGVAQSRKPGRCSMTGRIGTGAGALVAKTVSGDVTLLPRVHA
jgi:hypothetical protein